MRIKEKHGHSPSSGESPTYISWTKMKGEYEQQLKHGVNYKYET